MLIMMKRLDESCEIFSFVFFPFYFFIFTGKKKNKNKIKTKNKLDWKNKIKNSYGTFAYGFANKILLFLRKSGEFTN